MPTKNIVVALVACVVGYAIAFAVLLTRSCMPGAQLDWKPDCAHYCTENGWKPLTCNHHLSEDR